MLKKNLFFAAGIVMLIAFASFSAEAFSYSEARISRNQRPSRVTNRLFCQNGISNDRSRLCLDRSESSPVCGNNIIETGEACDGSAPAGYTCTNQCNLESDEAVAAVCGNNIIETGEACDGSAPAGFICSGQCLLISDESDTSQTEDVLPSALSVIKINELYAAVDNGDGEEITNEWVELYNTGNVAVDISGWQLVDSEGQVTLLPREIVIGAHEFVLLSPDSSTYVFWQHLIPGDAKKIELNQPIGNGLDFGGDYLVLRNAQGQFADGMSYGDDTTFFSLNGAGYEHTLSRNPNGRDTDTSDDWVQLSEPTPGF